MNKSMDIHGEKESPLMDAHEVSLVTGRSESNGYLIIRQLNEELRSKGYFVLRGRIPRRYFYERLGISE